MSNRSPFSSRSAFTLIELLVVIAIIAILAVVVVLTLNPAELLRQSRDANRVSDMATLNNAINLYNTDQSGQSTYSLGATSTAYISLPYTTGGCASLGLATSGYSYACAGSSTYRNASSSGWLPINFQNISSGSPFSNLPVDPTNQSSSNLYYSYETNGTTYAISSFMESQKYAKQMSTTGGADPALYEVGSGASTLPNATRGLVGYWPLNEGQGNTAIDWSGNGNNGTWVGGQVGTSGYYSAGKVWQWAGTFDGTSTKITIPYLSAITTTGTYTMATWFNTQSIAGALINISNGDSNRNGIILAVGKVCGGYYNGTTYVGPCASITTGTWNQVVIVNAGGAVTGYLNGNPFAGGIVANLYANQSDLGYSGNGNYYLNGAMGDVRIYDRALSAAEIQQLYNAEK